MQGGNCLLTCEKTGWIQIIIDFYNFFIEAEGCYVIIYSVLLYGQMVSLCDLQIRKIENESKL